ncbi:hypothetical protein [Marinicella meishanensis]|uniref:hypothetical protein n=1 Tax=Marinicella meishanensis TaxID=2873263 RepID=UPI001CC03342|nr:hypothetical protein [Marinicella sp. NBU2979]
MTDAFIILGMHRSGTSCLTGCLAAYGLNLGNVSTFNQYNQKGNQENHWVFRLNEAILKAHGGSWNQPPSSPLALSAEHQNRLLEVLAKYDQLPKPWGIKDPRMVLTYPLWQPHLPAHQLMGTFRHPLAVAESLLSRDAFPVPLEQGLALWSIYNQRLLETHAKQAFPIINFDEDETAYNQKIASMAEQFGLALNESAPFFEAALRNQSQYGWAECPDALKPLYRQLLDQAI